MSAVFPIPGVVAVDGAMRKLQQLVELVARSDIAVLVTGETGAGKEIASTAIHTRSPRASKPLVSLNCAALPEALLESELFGYERGAFTGATQSKLGLIESAHEGTLLLDEIGEMPLGTQAKLLRVLENGELTRVGALKPRVVDVRFIASTNRCLPSLVAAGMFRRDLYFRLNGITITVPPLRERPADIIPLSEHFLAHSAAKAGRRTPAHLASEVHPRLLGHPWPGNVRELRNVMDRALALCHNNIVCTEDILLDPPLPASAARLRAAEPAPEPTLSPPPLPSAPVGRLPRRDNDAERALIEQALERSGGNQAKAAAILGVSRRTLINRLDEYKMARPRKQVPAS